MTHTSCIQQYVSTVEVEGKPVVEVRDEVKRALFSLLLEQDTSMNDAGLLLSCYLCTNSG
jgi:hypothetical protein